MPKHKLAKNVCLEKIHSAVQQITMSIINLTVIIHVIMIIRKHTKKAHEEA
jgi:hypothetical protein